MRKEVVRAADGFTLIELLIAMIIIGGALLGLISLQLRALDVVNLSKQREQAVALANRTMEQLRALPYDTVTGGLNSSDTTISGDANIVSGSLNLTPNGINERLVVGSSGAVVPLNPHVSTVTFTNATYTVKSYVSLVSSTAGDTSKGYWLTVVVSWVSGATDGQSRSASSRSQVFSPSGCLATSTHPFAGPCQAFYDGGAGTTPAGISLSTAGASGTRPLTGNTVTTANVATTSVSADVQAEQTISTQGSAKTSAGTYADDTEAGGSTGGLAASTGASTDPTTGDASLPTNRPVVQVGPPLTKAGSSGSFILQPSVTDSGAAASTTAAATGSSCNNLAGAPVISGQACSSAQMTSTDGLAAVLSYGSTFPLASMAAATSGGPNRAFVSRYLTSGGSFCSSTSGTGCVSANVKRSLGTSRVGGVPSGSSVPANFANYMASVSDYIDTASAESGLGAVAPATTRTGTLSYWTGTAYAPVSLSASTSATYPLGTTATSYNGGATTVTMSGNVAVRPASVVTTTPAACQPTACTVTSTSGSVVAAVTYDIRTSGVQVGLFTVTLDLGSSLAKTSYRAAPSA